MGKNIECLKQGTAPFLQEKLQSCTTERVQAQDSSEHFWGTNFGNCFWIPAEYGSVMLPFFATNFPFMPHNVLVIIGLSTH